jgi:hypothetical protein
MSEEIRRQKSAEICRARNLRNKGKNYEQIYGKEKAELMRSRQSIAQLEASAKRCRGKTYEEIYGAKRAREIKERISFAVGGTGKPDYSTMISRLPKVRITRRHIGQSCLSYFDTRFEF